MPFPPDLTNVWDNTFPPDTQLANLLGQDLRNFRVDTQQRLSLLSGILANRPSNMDAIFGGAGYGILFFAIDTNQVFQWNGATWVDVSSGVFGGKASVTIGVVTNGAPQDGLVITILKGLLIPGSIIHVDAWVDCTTLGAGAFVQLQFNGNALLSVGAGPNIKLTADYVVRADNSIVGTGVGFSSLGNIFSNNSFPIDVSVGNNTIKTAQTNAGSGGFATHNMLNVWWK